MINTMFISNCQKIVNVPLHDQECQDTYSDILRTKNPFKMK